MLPVFKLLIGIALLLTFVAAGDTRAGADWDWTTATPESQGMDSARLEALWSNLQHKNTHALLVIRNDLIVFERYAAGYSRTTKHGTASLAKALVGGTSLMVAMNDGRIRPNDPAYKYVSQWANDPLKKRIVVRDLATHTSGIEDAEADDLPHDRLTGWKGEFWKQAPRDPFTLARDEAPVMEARATQARYSNPGMAMLAYCVTASLRGAEQNDIRSLLKHRIMEPLGVPEEEWSVGYGKTFAVDGLPLVADWGGGAFSPNATARIGRLMLNHGSWMDRQLIAPSVVHVATTYAGAPNHSGLGWWVNQQADGERKWKAAPKDAFWGAGAGHQFLLVIPSLNLILVRNGETLDATGDFNAALERQIVNPVMQAISRKRATLPSTPKESAPPKESSLLKGTSPSKETPLSKTTPRQQVEAQAPSRQSAPYPPSPLIKEIRWAPASTIVRRAFDCDCWPLTWGDDDSLYAAYGDGQGFDPKTPEKLSMGFAKITGSPTEFSGVNIRSATGETTGNGPAGKKPSGILMVHGVLYLWTRNADHAQLAWSTDHGHTWTWSPWKFTTSFGCPTFLNFGKNYAGARDRFVYTYSPDSATAYAPADRMVLARVPANRIRERSAYEFLQGLDAKGHPLWTHDIERRSAVFSNPGRCLRSQITYNPALKRYLWWQQIPGDGKSGADTRFRGGFGIYDAPEPWGPWTTAYSTEAWDVGPGESASFPTQWMSADGKTMHLVFSGDDYLSVRAATLILPGD